MTAPVFLLDPGELDAATAGGLVDVGGDEGRHGGAVLRLRAGEECQLVDGAGRRVTGSVVQSDRGGFQVEVREVDDEPERTPRLVVVQALAKGDRAEAAVEMLTEAGVDVIVPWSAARSVSVWRGDKADRGVRRWRSVAHAATKQSRRSRLPEVGDLQDSQGVAGLVEQASRAFVLHESSTEPLPELVGRQLHEAGDIVVIVGPEGGITDQELDLLRNAGADVAALGPTVLRTSTAGVVAVAVLAAAAGRWERR